MGWGGQRTQSCSRGEMAKRGGVAKRGAVYLLRAATLEASDFKADSRLDKR